jgi:CheY-like chemotaxis protein
MNPIIYDSDIKILLADDDRDDRHFFVRALKNIRMSTALKTVEDGQQLMDYLVDKSTILPDVLFLDINMPRKNGLQCMLEIKSKENLRDIPVIIYSTAVPDDVADIVYDNGAHFYIRKSDQFQLEKNISYVLSTLVENRFTRVSRSEFVIEVTKGRSLRHKQVR